MYTEGWEGDSEWGKREHRIAGKKVGSEEGRKIVQEVGREKWSKKSFLFFHPVYIQFSSVQSLSRV